MPATLKEYLGHDLSTCSPVELESLRDLWAAIRDGATTWADALAERRGASRPA